MQWEIYSTKIIDEPDLIDLYFFLDKQKPLALTSLILLEFDTADQCKAYLASQAMDPEECQGREMQMSYSGEEQLPETQRYLENHDLRINLDSKDGSIVSIFQKRENVKVDMRQRFMTYDGKIQTNSGLYIFNPQHEAQDFKYDMKIEKIYIFEGELMKCI